MTQETQFWGTLIATVLIGPAIQTILTIVSNAYLIRYTDKELAKLREELKGKEEQNETRIKKLKEMNDAYKKSLSEGHKVAEKAIILLERMGEILFKNAKNGEKRENSEKDTKENKESQKQ